MLGCTWHPDIDSMNEQILDTLANVAITLAAFSGVVVVFRVRGAHTWSPTELRVLWFLIGDCFLVVFLALLPAPLALLDWSPDTVWAVCSGLLASWFLVGGLLALWGERRDRAARQWVFIPVITPILYGIYGVALVMGIALWLSVWDFVVPLGQGIFVLGLIVLLAVAAVEFLFFIVVMSQQDRDQ